MTATPYTDTARLVACYAALHRDCDNAMRDWLTRRVLRLSARLAPFGWITTIDRQTGYARQWRTGRDMAAMWAYLRATSATVVTHAIDVMHAPLVVHPDFAPVIVDRVTGAIKPNWNYDPVEYLA